MSNWKRGKLKLLAEASFRMLDGYRLIFKRNGKVEGEESSRPG